MTEEDFGPLLRPYTLTRGRTRPTGPEFDLMTVIRARPTGDAAGLAPEHLRILRIIRTVAVPVADLAAEVGLSLNVVRILLGDLRDRGLISSAVLAGGSQPEARVLLEVIQGLRSL
ncbi:DUF742 domain-containing protein [Streptosporangiaceae bacterium NEAU-GS5]|nr:DUF742 domain-containing protein [Streptosporangiaceae bacterium NEAU-GS5]